MNIDRIYRNIQEIFSYKLLLVVGSGASCALDGNFGVYALSEHLKQIIPGLVNGNDALSSEWNSVAEKLSKGIQLEDALNDTSDELVAVIVKESGRFIAGHDRLQKIEVLKRKITLPLSPLLELIMKNNLSSSSNNKLDVITSNYDLLIEHACDMIKLPYLTGFSGGVCKQYNWRHCLEEQSFISQKTERKKKIEVKRIRPHLRLYKVHGSLNWFKDGDRVIEDNSMLYSDDLGLERLLITPGNSKYKKLLDDNAKLYTEANNAIGSANAIVFIGYGFNDKHIESMMIDKLIHKKTPALIITKDFSTTIEDMLRKDVKMHAVCQSPEKSKDSIIAISKGGKEYDRIYLENLAIWKIEEFVKNIMCGGC